MAIDWADIPEFPGYVVTNQGVVINARTDMPLRPSVNQQGICHVGMVQDGKQIRRSVAVLVAEAFLPKPALKNYDTPIHLDGDKENCHAANLMWRPRWFAIEYHRQFHGHVDQAWMNLPVTLATTGEEFDRAIDLAMTHGLLVRDIVVASMNPGKLVPIVWSEIH